MGDNLRSTTPTRKRNWNSESRNLRRRTSLPLSRVPPALCTDEVQQLVNGMSSRLRQWAKCEWFYASLDREYFAHNEFQQCLDSLELSHIRALSRAEWLAIRATMGQPRRLSEKFLAEERRKLSVYRSSIRNAQSGAGHMPSGNFPYEIPVPISVGDHVSAYHPRAKLFCRGHVLATDSSNHCCQVQFERPELGTEICNDLDIAVHGGSRALYRRQEVLSQRDEDVAYICNGVENRGAIMAGLSPVDERERERCSLEVIEGGDSSVVLTSFSVCTLDFQGETSKVEEMEASVVGSMTTTAEATERHTLAQLTLVASISKLLERKEALVSALAELNNTAEKISQGQGVKSCDVADDAVAPKGVHNAGEKSENSDDENEISGFEDERRAVDIRDAMEGFSSEFSKNFQQQYAWLVANLEETNRALEPALRQLQLLSNEDYRFGKICDPKKDPAADATMLNSCASILESSRQTAQAVVSAVNSRLVDHSSFRQGRVPHAVKGLDILIEACVSLLGVVQHSSSTALAPQEMARVYSMALCAVKPKYVENKGLLREMEESLALLHHQIVT